MGEKRKLDDDIEVMRFGDEAQPQWRTHCDCAACYSVCNCGPCPLEHAAKDWSAHAISTAQGLQNPEE